MQNETPLMKAIRAALSKLPGVRLFRNNVGTAWQGDVKTYPAQYVEIQKARLVNFGLCEGSSDLIGWVPVTVTPEMVGKVVAIFTAPEAKTPKGKARDMQTVFIAAVRAAGGFAFVARSEAEAEALLREQVRELKS